MINFENIEEFLKLDRNKIFKKCVVIDPCNLSKEAKQSLINIMTQYMPEFIEDNIKFESEPYDFTLKNNLILNQDGSKDGIISYYVISKEKKDMLGKGATSKVRAIVARIDIDLNKQDIFCSPCTDKAVRITNTKKAQEKHYNEGTEYNPLSAIDNYKKYSDSHIHVEYPIEMTREVGMGLFHTKSYTVTDKLPGQDLTMECNDFIDNEVPSLKEFIDLLIIPLLEAYKKQVQDKGYVHCDIKEENIRGEYHPEGFTINFLDFDYRLKIGSIYPSIRGTPGYIPPEKLSENKEQTSRDVFALGVALIGLICPKLNPWDTDMKNVGLTDNIKTMEKLIRELKSYDPLKLLELLEKTYGIPCDKKNPIDEFFKDIPEDNEEAKLETVAILKQMTAYNPKVRPSIDEAIAKFKAISNSLKQEKTHDNYEVNNSNRLFKTPKESYSDSQNNIEENPYQVISEV